MTGLQHNEEATIMSKALGDSYPKSPGSFCSVPVTNESDWSSVSCASLSLVSTVNEHHTISKPKDPLICTLVSEEPGGKWVFLALCVVQIALEHRSKAVAKRTSH